MLFEISVTGISALALSLDIQAIPGYKSSITGIINIIANAGARVFQYVASRLSDSYGSASIAYINLAGLCLLIVASMLLQLINKIKYYRSNSVL